MQTDWAQVLQYSFQTIWVEMIGILPQIVVAILIIISGWIISGILKSIIERIFRTLKIDSALDAAGVDTLTAKAGYPLNSGGFVGTLVKWFVLIVFFVAALDVLGLQQATFFLRDTVLGYLPQVIVAVLILFGGMILSTFLQKVVEAAAKSGGFAAAHMLGAFAKYAVIVFAVLAALNQLAIAPELVQMLFAGLVFALSLGLGLAFGLGGRDAAAKYLASMTGDRSGGGHNNH